MSKKYAAPVLTLKGDAVELTKAIAIGTGDPMDPATFLYLSSGSTGFNL